MSQKRNFEMKQLKTFESVRFEIWNQINDVFLPKHSFSQMRIHGKLFRNIAILPAAFRSSRCNKSWFVFWNNIMQNQNLTRTCACLWEIEKADPKKSCFCGLSIDKFVTKKNISKFNTFLHFVCWLKTFKWSSTKTLAVFKTLSWCAPELVRNY